MNRDKSVMAHHTRPDEQDTKVARVDGETVEYDPETGEARRLPATTLGVPGPSVGE